MSLRWKIPFAVLPVLAGIVIGVATAAYVQIKNAAIEADRSHLESASLEVAHLLEASLQRLRVDLRPLGSDARIVQALEGPSALDSARVSRALNDFRTQHAPRYIGVALCSVTGRVVAQVGVVPPDAIGDCRQHTTGPSAAATRVTPLRAHGDTITYSVRWWIESPSHGILGFLVAARSLGDPTTSAAIAKLVSLNANVLLGNVDGTLWTNFSKRVPGPPTSTPMDGGRHTHADGSEYVGAKSKVAGSPWAVWAESPTRVPIAMARAFVGEVLLVGLVLVVAGAVIVSWLVRRSLRPLDDVATAATALAYGAPTPVVPVGGPSELASLAHSFNTMANQVEASAQQLRTRADDLEVRNRELRESEGRYRQLVDQSPDGVVVHRDNTILFANRVIADLVGAEEPSRLFGRSVLDLVEPAHREEARRGVLAIRNSGQASKLTEMILQRLDGSTFTAEVNGTPIVFDGAPAIQTIARDITDRQQLEARVRHGQKLEAVGRLAGGIAHDFNNLLTIVLAHADLGLQRPPRQ